MDACQPHFAGSWYPATAEGCRKQIDAYLARPSPIEAPAGARTGGIVPHAGWAFSGAIACRVIAAVAAADPPDVVVIFGTHLPPGAPPILLSEGVCHTPLGDLPVAKTLARRLMERFDFQVETPRTARPDNTIELQLPFVRHLCGGVQILPIGAPPSPLSLDIGREVAALAADEGLSVKALGSTDLTHYGPNYGRTERGRGKAAVDWVKRENDRRFIDALLALDGAGAIAEAGLRENACCAGAAAAALSCAVAMGADRAVLSEYRTSYDRMPDDSFVGYCGVVFYRSSV